MVGRYRSDDALDLRLDEIESGAPAVPPFSPWPREDEYGNPYPKREDLPWTPGEDRVLAAARRRGEEPEELSKRHQRLATSVWERLDELGIEDEILESTDWEFGDDGGSSTSTDATQEPGSVSRGEYFAYKRSMTDDPGDWEELRRQELEG
jgi:hypothetical protein